MYCRECGEKIADASVFCSYCGAKQVEDSISSESTMANIILKDVGDNKVMVMKVLREATGLGLKEAKEIVEGVQVGMEYTIRGISQEHARAIVNDFIQIGALVTIELDR